MDEALLNPSFGRTLALKAPAASDKVRVPLRAQFARIGRSTALGLTVGQSTDGSRPTGR